MADDELPEPAQTQEWVQRQFGAPGRSSLNRPATSTETEQSRQDSRVDLKRIPGLDAQRFRRENPDADLYDWQRYQQQRDYENRGNSGRMRGR